MKKKIVLWGSDENDKKLLLALELLPKENTVKLYSFPEEIATEDFYNQLMNDWREDKEVTFPEGHTLIDRPLSMTEDLLPENIKVQRTDIITRAKTEWHFVVLSTKLYDLYQSELDEFKDRISRLADYDGAIFEEMKAFWTKVSEQARERNLFRGQTEKLKKQTNELFDRLKELRSKANAEFSKFSKENKETFSKRLAEINEKIEKGLGLNPIFDELKNIQNEFKAAKFTREDRSSLWQSIDEAFKKVKEKKYGKEQSSSTGPSRLQRRYEGLLSAIDKMEKSIARDEKDIAFQTKRADETQGQLEMQIRQAKVKMVQERIDSKKEKLSDMLTTKAELEQRLEKEKKKQAKDEEKKQVKEKAEELKEKIAVEINQKSEELKESSDSLEEAAKALNETKSSKQAKAEPEESLTESVKTVVTEMIEDVVDTVKAVTEVVEEKLEEKVDSVKESIKEKSEEMGIDKKVEEVKAKAEEIKDTIEEKVEKIVDKITEEEE